MAIINIIIQLIINITIKDTLKFNEENKTFNYYGIV